MTGTELAIEPVLGHRSSVQETRASAILGLVADRLTAETGLAFPGSRRANLRRALATVASEAALVDNHSILDQLDRQPRLLARLISQVTIGETYFFRHPEQLDIVSRRILPSLIAEGTDDGAPAIRAWCAGCSTGEEAYTLAILAGEALDSHRGLEFRVVATDIDHDAVRRAKAASYGRWSFRTEIGDRGRWFEVDGERRRVRRSVADAVTFSTDNLNLADAGAPAGLDGPPNLILCRNVTMYFSVEARKRVADRFLRALAPGGWLVVAPVELSSSVYAAFETVVLDGLTFYRRPPLGAARRRAEDLLAWRGATLARPVPALRPHGSSPAAGPAVPESRTAKAHAPPSPPAPGCRPRLTPSPAPDPVERLAMAHRFADQGLMAEAQRESDLATREDPHGRRGYLLQASIADAQDDLKAAAAALRRALYLDRTDAAAQFRLGLIEWRMGRKRHARARLASAVELVAGQDEAAMLDADSDLTVGRLRSTAEMLADG